MYDYTYNNEINGVSQYGFVRLWSAFVVSYNLPLIIDCNELETKLFEYKDDEEYKKLFNDVDFIETEDSKYANLEYGFNFAKTMDIIEFDENEEFAYIMIDIDDANNILCDYNSNILNSMHDLFDKVQLKSNKRIRS